MNLSVKNITRIKIIGFLLMIGLMVYLNDKINSDDKEKTSESQIYTPNDDSGLVTSSARIPDKAEGAIPLKLISNPNSNFLFLFNTSHKVIFNSRFLQLEKTYLEYCCKTRASFLIEYLATMRNKDIR